MAKNSITDYSGTSSNNSDVQSVDISEGCSPSGINNAIREVMADLADVNDGTVALTSPSAVTLSTDTISEKTSGSGVTIDSVLLKDGALGSIASAVAAHLTSINGGQIGGNRNLIINGAMQVSQRGDSTGVTSSKYAANDRFRFTIGNAGTWDISQSTTAPTGFSSSYKVDCTTADASLASSDFLFLEQRIEAQNLQHLSYGTSDAKKITLSFYVRSNKTGTYAIEFQHGDAGTNYWNNNTYTISAADTWEQKTITISGQTATAINNDTGIGLYVRWWLVSGTQYSSGTVTNDTWHQTDANRAAGQVNLADSTSNEFYLTGVQLEVGDTATEFEHRSYADELHRCRRFYQKITGTSYYGGFHAYTGSTSIYVQLIPAMRAAPTVTNYNVRNGSTGATASNQAANYGAIDGFNAPIDGSGGSDTHFSHINQATLEASAEL